MSARIASATLWRVIAMLAAVGYPLGLHLAIVTQRHSVALLILAGTAALQVLLRHIRGDRGPVRWVLIGVFALALLSGWMGDMRALYLPPILISGAMFYLFAASLLPGREPLVTRFERQMEGHDEPATHPYTRRVTQVWAGFLLAMLIECIVLALVAPLELWSLFTNVLNYLFIAALFVAEFAVRALRFQRLPHLGGLRRRFAVVANPRPSR